MSIFLSIGTFIVTNTWVGVKVHVAHEICIASVAIFQAWENMFVLTILTPDCSSLVVKIYLGIKLARHSMLAEVKADTKSCKCLIFKR
jgi:hypothetical protein